MDVRCRIELLGRLRVQQGDREITRFRTQKTGALLGYLAYHLERTHPREVLMDLLWPESAPATGRQSLSMALSSLRHQLEPPGVPRGTIVRADRFSVQLNPELVTTDVAEFEAAQQSAAEAGSDTERAQFLAEAVELYGGELLPGYYQDWIIPEQRRLGELYFRTVRWLTTYLEQAGEWERALECARRAVAADPFREEGHQDLIRLLAASGQSAEALRQYEELERILNEELEAAPSAATCELARQIELQVEERGAVAVPEPLPAPVSHLPTGTVTFLLTDIEGAGRLQEQAGQAFQEALEGHNDLLRQAFSRHGGQEVREAGGSFTVAFAHPSEALACAVECQRELSAHSWPEEVGPLPVRMALHTREVKPKEDEAPGWLLSRGTALLLAVHGGQILCSEASAGLLRRSLPTGVKLAELGYYRLRGTEEPEPLFAVEYPGMEPGAFPPPKAAPAYTSNLPVQLTAFFGREDELVRLEELLLEEERRLVTLTGPGGSGKTRLALEAAGPLSEAFRGAVWLVELQDLTDPQLIVDAVVVSLGLPRLPEVEPLEQASAALSRQRSLLVLDNFEHLVDEGSAVVHTLLERIPMLTCLVTSRRRLGLTGEREFLVAPLPTPSGDESPEGLMRFASVELFVDRAQAVRPDFQVTERNDRSVAELCYRLEGIPLALELAAARAQVFTPAQMVAELEHRFDFLVSRKRDVDGRHRTLRAAMDWSYRLLTPELQRFFAQLSVFRGGWTGEAAKEVCDEPRALEYLEELRACSLILAEESADGAGAMRFRMLETLREYAREQLSPKEQAALSQRHAEHYLALAEEAEPKLGGPEQVVWLDRLETEHDNLRAALHWYMIAESGAEAGLRLAAALGRVWYKRGYWSEGRARLREVLARAEAAGRTAVRATALSRAGSLASGQGDYAAARALHEESLAIRQELGDQRGIAVSLHGLGLVAYYQARFAAAGALLEESLAIRRDLEEKQGIAASLTDLGVVAYHQGDYEAAHSVWEESLAIQREAGDRPGIAESLVHMGTLAIVKGDYARARGLVEESLAAARESGEKPRIAWSLNEAGNVAFCQGDYAAARALHEQSLATFGDLGYKRGAAFSLHGLGLVAAAQGDYASARSLFEESLATRSELGDQRGIPECVEGLAGVQGAQKQPERAARLFGAAEAVREAIGAPLRPNERDRYDGAVAALRAALGKDAFEAAWAAGRAMTVEEAVAYALEEGEHE